MAQFQISHSLLEYLCYRNRFPVLQQGMVFLGIRGASPVIADYQSFAASHELILTMPDNQHPCCTLVQWLPKQKTLAVFPGSTIPHKKYIRKAFAKGGAGANQLLSGYYHDYRKGDHNLDSPTRHRAFRQTEARFVLRTIDDLVYETDDRMEYNNPFDNLHAGWCMGVNHADFASAGCQVIVGYPHCAQRGSLPDTGPWATFVGNAYAQPQDRFPYVLLTGQDYFRAYVGNMAESDFRLRYGSAGTEVQELQQRLKAKRFYEGQVDDQFGKRTMNAVLAFQRASFGKDAADGIVGPVTMSAL
jgi:hypothetical protein